MRNIVNAENTILPSDLIPRLPKYFVWYTGTLGQAEWLISYSKILRGCSIPKWCSKDLSNTPEKILPLLSLEQPDLIVTDNENNPILSAEITEQRSFGTNAQQRAARFWSAVINKVPSAYILPLESYQIDKIDKKKNPKAVEKIKNILNESDVNKKNFLLFCDTLLYVHGEKTYDSGLKTPAALIQAIELGDYSMISGVAEKTIEKLKLFIKKFIAPVGKVAHIKNVPPEEVYHKVDNTYFKTYIRKPEIPDSMLLEWFNLCSMTVPTYTFKLQCEIKNLFRTNGIPHIISESNNPHLSFRNLPPRPGQSEVVHKHNNNKKDEIELFFEFVDACIKKEDYDGSLRSKMMSSGEYWDDTMRNKWFSKIQAISDIDSKKSGDFSCSAKVLSKFILKKDANIPKSYMDHFQNFTEAHIYKIYNNKTTRGFYDPYSGNLAVRDILFTRDLTTDDNLINFKRKKPLIFWVDLEKDSAKNHKFIFAFINRIFEDHYVGKLLDSMSEQDKVIWLLNNVKIHKIIKEIRCHLLFCDAIIVRRKHLKGKIEYEIIFGIPTLLSLGLINKNSESIKSLIL